jgi:hypothetical protein
MLTDTQIRNKVRQLRTRHGKTYAPVRYFRGLTSLRDVERRYLKMLNKTYTPFPTDKGPSLPKRTSSYTRKFRKMYGDDVRTLPQISKATGVPLRTLRTVYDRGLAAWRTGHRPRASPQAWAYARVHSFVTKGKTWHTADRNLRPKYVDLAIQ